MMESFSKIKQESALRAKELRSSMIDSFDKQLRFKDASFKKGKSRFWTARINDNVYFYVSFEFPKYIEGDSTASIFYGLQNNYVKPSENMSVEKTKYIKWSYKNHHKLFEFSHVAWNKQRVSRLYWMLLMQRKKVHYYTQDQTDYATTILFPLAVNQIVASYKSAHNKYNDTDFALRDLRVK